MDKLAETTTVEEDLAALESESAPVESEETQETAEQVESPELEAEVIEEAPEETESKKEPRDSRVTDYYKERARANQLEQENLQLKQAQTQAQQSAIPAPDYDDFDTDAEYFAATAKHEATQAIEAYKVEQSQTSDINSRADAQQSFSKKVAAANIPNYDDKANTLMDSVGMRPDTLGALYEMEGDVGPKLVAYLADHLDIADGISPGQLGVLAGKLSATKPVQQTKAPPVVTPIKGTSSTGKSFDDPTAEFSNDEVRDMILNMPDD